MSKSSVRAALLVALACAAAPPPHAAAQTTRERLRVEKERADRERAERERVERDRIDRDRMDRDRMDRERDERDRVASDRLERERVERERADRERERDRAERERDRERDRAWERAREVRERALEQAERDREYRLREARERATRERLERERQIRDRALVAERARREAELRRESELRRAVELRRTLERERAARQRDLRRRYRDEWRPRVSLSGGLDIREFDGADDRYVVQGGVDFRTRSGLGMRPEVTYAWSDANRGLQSVVGPTGTPIGTVSVGRSRALGVMVNATYTFFRGSAVRPYVLGGPGVLSTRLAAVEAAQVVVQPGTTTVLTTVPARHDLDVGLNAGAGIELSLGPVRLFTETRYFLTDSPPTRGFSGMVPITAGIRF